MGCVTHVILDTRPSHFSACSIEKLGMAGEEANVHLGVHIIKFALYKKFSDTCDKILHIC